jgi:hypothetical protein
LNHANRQVTGSFEDLLYIQSFGDPQEYIFQGSLKMQIFLLLTLVEEDSQEGDFVILYHRL